MKKKQLLICAISALLLAGCGSSAPSARSTNAVPSGAQIQAPTIQGVTESSCPGTKLSPIYMFGSEFPRECTGAEFDLSATWSTPMVAGSPVAISLWDPGYPKALQLSVSGGELKPVGPWISQTTPTQAELPPFGALTITDGTTLVTTAIAPTSIVPALSPLTTEEAAWVWHPPISGGMLSLSGIKSISIPAARSLPGQSVVTPVISKTITLGLGLSAPSSSAAAAASYIASHGITGEIKGTSTGTPNVTPSPVIPRVETVSGEIYTWSNPIVGQSVTLSDTVQNVPVSWTTSSDSVIYAFDSTEGNIQLLEGLKVVSCSGPLEMSSTSQGQSTEQLWINAPSPTQLRHFQVGHVIPLSLGITSGNGDVSGQPITVTSSSSPGVKLVIKLSSSGGVTVRPMKPGKLIVTARSGCMVASTVMIVPGPGFPWWLLLIIIAAALTIIVLIIRRIRKRCQRKVSDNSIEESLTDDGE